MKDKILSFKDNIKGIEHITFGKNISPGRCKGYTHAVSIIFKDKKSLEEFIPHEEHQKVVQITKSYALDSPICLDWDI